MKKYLLIIVLLFICSGNIFSQEVQKKYKYTPEELAQKKIDKIAPELNLTDEQQKTVYDEFVKYIKKRREDNETLGSEGKENIQKMRKERLKELRESLKGTLTKEQIRKFIELSKSKNK